MGKRELLLIVGFIVAGAIVYQATAPPPAPGEQGFSLSRIVEKMRREVRGNRASAEVTNSERHPLAPATTELRVALSADSLTITGEERADIASELHVRSTGYDEAEAQSLAAATKLKANEAAGSISFNLPYPKGGRQRATLVLKVPSRLRLQVRYAGRLTISGISSVELLDTRGEATIREVNGRISGAHRNGDMTITDVGQLKLTFRNCDARLTRVRGETSLQTQGGEVRASEITGVIDLETNGTDVMLEHLEKAKGPIRLNAVGGSVTLRGVSADARVDGRNTEIDVTMEQAAPVAIYNDGDEPIELTTPPNGFQMDLLAAAGGRIRLPEGMLEIKSDETEQRATGSIRGGGPTITLRANRGNITIRTRGAESTTESKSR